MPKSPTRSEIESALSSKKHNARNRTPKKPSSELELSDAPRRQQVIGGDLSGVNKRDKFGIFSRYSDVSVANWVAGFVILLIVAAFFWPQPENTITEVAKQLDDNKVIASEDALLEQAVRGNASFARDTDAIRANEFRKEDAIDTQVKELLDVAAEHIKQRRFTQPRDNNAVLIYYDVLELRPSNPDAIEGLSKIRQFFLYRGINALDGDKPALAKSNLQRLGLVDKESIEYEELDSAIGEYTIEQEVSQRIQQAEKALSQGQLTLPESGNALAYYQQALTLRPENKIAQEGIKRVADALIEQANAAVLSNDFDAASMQLAKVTLIDPEHKSIALIEAMISRAKPLAEQAQTQSNSEQPIPSSGVVPSGQTQDETPDDNTNELLNDQTSLPATALPSDQISDANNISTKTPPEQANEQAQLDKQYLQEGLNAYYNGDFDKAAVLLQPLADKGIARAQIKLAYMHFLARGYPRDRAKAEGIIRSTLPAIRKFANEGRAWAQSDLGSLYEDGLVLPRNYGEAVYWYRTAAEKGYPGAQTSLGLMYARGRGVATSRKTAVEWFQRAAKQGNRLAQRNLDNMSAGQ